MKTAHAWRFFNARTSWLKKRQAFVLKKRCMGYVCAIIMQSILMRYHE